MLTEERYTYVVIANVCVSVYDICKRTPTEHILELADMYNIRVVCMLNVYVR